ncbi:TetR/AcrR family transcriptional regulator [Pseudonocardia acaciae]|uniref:TetR/AcrR family transcriptional regulator n=1 Tax=Pseudonocardia acaciae TaxID=551276 RepID=UPI000A02FAC2|nr:TetR/AcrR family transcriptional regulator [Pseudonocardia acaciae]
MISTSDVADSGRGSSPAVGPDCIDHCAEDSADHRRAPRRRGDALTAAIFEATVAELSEGGYAELTMERVAARARASKGSLYRRWGSRAELVVDALQHTRPHDVPAPNTGSVREDLLAFLRAIAAIHDSTSGEANRGMMVEVVRDPELMRVIRVRFIEPGIANVLEILRRGVVRGTVRPTALTHRIAGVGLSLLRQYFLLHGAPVPDSVIVEIVDDVMMPLVSVR